MSGLIELDMDATVLDTEGPGKQMDACVRKRNKTTLYVHAQAECTCLWANSRVLRWAAIIEEDGYEDRGSNVKPVRG